MDYFCLNITCDTASAEILTAFLGQQPFEVFEDTADGLKAYIPTDKYTDEEKERTAELLLQYAATAETVHIEAQNWNAEWESQFQPIILEGFCAVRASFHPKVENVTHELIIDPKMAFGTGHHETTRLVMQTMGAVDFTDKKVLDMGCGTGILALLAERLGAASVDAIDIDPIAVENTTENLQLNNSEKINPYQGVIDDVKSDQYDIILANINRNVLLQYLPALYKMLPPKGVLIISGILDYDGALISAMAVQLQFKDAWIFTEGDWLCYLFTK